MNREKLTELAQALQLAESARKAAGAITIRSGGSMGTEIHMQTMTGAFEPAELKVKDWRHDKDGELVYIAVADIEGIKVFSLLTESEGKELIAKGATKK